MDAARSPPGATRGGAAATPGTIQAATVGCRDDTVHTEDRPIAPRAVEARIRALAARRRVSRGPAAGRHGCADLGRGGLRHGPVNDGTGICLNRAPCGPARSTAPSDSTRAGSEEALCLKDGSWQDRRVSLQSARIGDGPSPSNRRHADSQQLGELRTARESLRFSVSPCH